MLNLPLSHHDESTFSVDGHHARTSADRPQPTLNLAFGDDALLLASAFAGPLLIEDRNCLGLLGM